MSALVFKIVHAGEWASVRDAYAGSQKDRADGFLHFSTQEQLPGTLTRYYAGADDLLLVAVDAEALGPALRFEASTGGALYPHLYASLPRSAARWVRPIPRDGAGGFVLPIDAQG
ncbi:MAG TPA: DUF952 domain-containing protein [Rhizomicrobium sp.]|nr:DUF952 domain-containing protein [Rhizomicrobium sp.]